MNGSMLFAIVLGCVGFTACLTALLIWAYGSLGPKPEPVLEPPPPPPPLPEPVVIHNPLAPCPFCGAPDVVTYATAPPDRSYPSTYVRCLHCRATGPKIEGIYEGAVQPAIKAWQKRKPPVADGAFGRIADALGCHWSKGGGAG